MIKPILILADEYDYTLIKDVSDEPKTTGKLYLPRPHGSMVEYYDIILIDTEAEIVDGDLVYGWDKIIVWNSQEQGTISPTGYYKIVSSTNKEHNPSQLSHQSIQIFIKFYNEFKCMPNSIRIKTIDTTRCAKCKQLMYHWRCECGESYNNTVQKEIQLIQQGEIDILKVDKYLQFLEERLRLACSGSSSIAYSLCIEEYKKHL